MLEHAAVKLNAVKRDGPAVICQGYDLSIAFHKKLQKLYEPFKHTAPGVEPC